MFKVTCTDCCAEFEGRHPKITQCANCRLQMQQQIVERFVVGTWYINKASNRRYLLLKVGHEDDAYLPRISMLFQTHSSKSQLRYLSNTKDRAFVEQLEECHAFNELLSFKQNPE